MSQLTQIVRRYAALVKNGRTNQSIVDHMRGEVDEVEEEVQADEPGEDGIVGECIDVIACALDLIFVNYPNITDEQLDAIMERKCVKWHIKYG